MPSMNVSIPEPMRRWVESQVKLGKYGNTSEYIRELIRKDQKQRSQEELEELLLEGLKGPNSAMTRKDWDKIRAEVTRRLTHGGVVSGGEKRKKEPAGKR